MAYYESKNIVMSCTNPGGCVMTEGDIWCLRGENGHICEHLQIGGFVKEINPEGLLGD